MKKLLFSILLVSCCAWNSRGQSNELQLIDVFQLEYVSDPQISQDGSKIIYVRNYKDVMTDRNLSNLWIINFDGSNNHPVTTGNHNDTSPRWSPDGTKLLYRSNKDGKTQFYLRWLGSGAETKLTNLPKSPGAGTWSPDGNWIAFSMFVPESAKPFVSLPTKPEGAEWNDPPKYIDRLNYRSDGAGYLKLGYNQLFVLSVDGGTPRQITSGPYNHRGGVSWAKDGSKLYFSANRHENNEYEPANSEIYVVSLLGRVSHNDLHGRARRLFEDLDPRRHRLDANGLGPLRHREGPTLRDDHVVCPAEERHGAGSLGRKGRRHGECRQGDRQRDRGAAEIRYHRVVCLRSGCVAQVGPVLVSTYWTVDRPELR